MKTETPRTCTLEGALFGLKLVGADGEIKPAERIQFVEKAPVDAERERMLDLLRAVAITSFDHLVSEEHDCDDLFEKGLVRSVRDITDEYETILTDEGREAIKALVEHGRLSGEEGSSLVSVESCGRIMVGYGIGWHPTCKLPKGHAGQCKSPAEEGSNEA